jgi:predicted nucleic acid-binding protein
VIVYLDTSTVLRVILGEPRPLAVWGKWKEAFTSEILGLEARRALDRLRLESVLDDEGIATLQGELARIESTIGTISLTRSVLRRASLPMATPVKTLDAIHLASALLLREHRYEELIFATHDARQAIAARALGFECVGV